MKKNKIILLAIVILIILGIMILLPKINSALKPTGQQPATEEIDNQPLNLIINFGPDQSLAFSNDFQPETTVYQLLQQTAMDNDIILETKQYDFGILIEKIGDYANGDDNKYWHYYINGQMPMISVDNYQLKAGDSIEFKFGKSQF